jgi:hypothetical protein
MITINIDGMSQKDENITQQWITIQINTGNSI